MRERFEHVLPTRFATVAVVAYLTIVLSTVSTVRAEEDPWAVARNELGQPDLEGVWSNNTATPLERPEAFAGKERLTDTELEALQSRLVELREDLQAGDLLGDFLIQKVLEDPEFRGFDQQTGNYNSFWLVERELDNRTSLIVDPPNGRLPAMKPEALGRLMERGRFGNTRPEGPEDLSSNERCVSYGVPNTLAGYNSYFRFLQTRGFVLIQQELIHHARIIPLDDRPALPQGLRFWNGASRGRWEGDTLVVETRHYNDAGAYRGATRDLRVVERFTRTGPDVLEWEITFEDPATWESPWTMMIPLNRTEDRIYEYACHEANYSLEGILAGARLQEDEGADG